MFRALCRSSSETSTVFAASGLHMLVETARGAVWVGTGQFPLRRHHGRSPQAYVNHKLQIQLRFLMMYDITLETCWTINVLWNNKIPLLSCILLVIATSHTTMHGSMNIKNEQSFVAMHRRPCTWRPEFVLVLPAISICYKLLLCNTQYFFI